MVEVAQPHCRKTVLDGGSVWQDLTAPFAGSALDFINRDTGWLSVMGNIYNTTDGGNSWVKQVELFDSTIVSMEFIDANQGWAKSRTKVYATADGDANKYIQKQRSQLTQHHTIK